MPPSLTQLKYQYQVARNEAQFNEALALLELIQPYISPKPSTNDERLFAAWVYAEFGYLYWDLDERDKAIAAFECALQVDPFSHVEHDLAKLRLGMVRDGGLERTLPIPVDPFEYT